MSPTDLIIAALVGGLACGVNSATGGGGSLLSFPVLVFLGIAPVTANATNSLAMWLGGVSWMRRYRGVLAHPSPRVRTTLLICVAGGISGGVILVHMPEKTFSAMIPWVMLFGTVLFGVGPVLQAEQYAKDGGGIVREPPAWSLLPLFVVSVYGGFFGSGQGFLLLALFTAVGMLDVQRTRALKVVLAFVNNGVPLALFMLAGIVRWDTALVTSLGGIVGGYYGPRALRRIPAPVLYWVIFAIGLAMTVVFFMRG